MNDPRLALVTLTEEVRLEFLALAGDYLAAGEERYGSASDDFHAYLRSLREGRPADPLRRIREHPHRLSSPSATE